MFTVVSNFSANISPSSLTLRQELNSQNVPLRLPGGFRYAPPGVNQYTPFEGRSVAGADGTWKEIILSPGYEWGNVSATYDLFTWPGASSVYHARIGNTTIGTIHIGKFGYARDSIEGAPATFFNEANYTLNPEVHGYPMKVAFANNSIYQLGKLITDRRTGEFGYFLTQIPLSSEEAASTMFELPKNLVAYDASAIADCEMEWTKIWYSSSWKTLYVICTIPTLTNDLGSSLTRRILVSQFKNGDKALSKPITTSTQVKEMIIQPIEASNLGIWVYVGSSFGNQEGFAIDPASGSLYSIDTAFRSVSISEPFGQSIAGDDSFLVEERNPVKDNLALIIAGAIAGLLLVLIAICYIPFRRRWRRSWRGRWVVFKEQTWSPTMRKVRLKLIDLLKEKDTDNNNKDDADDADSHVLQGKRDISKESEDGLNNNKFEDYTVTSLDGLEGCDKILVTDDTDLSGLENPLVMDVATGYMNGVRLEAHPRPGVVTSLALRDKRGSSSGSLLSSFEGSNDSSPPPGYPTLVAPSAPPLLSQTPHSRLSHK
ncbi:hypothetical protein BGZ96_000148 [Linnemannia gamsii]|uniref:Peptidase A1 domain-containing protein n=1 Tax=Linnemannia gamsii TaxID=64522 RepID=A0ABQ7JQ24_9FUNG|nr:hypothetical protein BGZ96_000148 [Linnemannia gamsii]